jgi:GT2 family glycosyltransferase
MDGPSEELAVGIAILTWRGEAVTRRCVEGALSLAGGPYPILVIDNHSGTGEGEAIAESLGVESVELPENGGVPLGYNAGAAWALRKGFAHVLLLNNDLEFPDAHLVERLLGAAQVGVSGHLQRPLTSDGGPYEVDWVDGSCMLVATAALATIGGLAPEYFMYWEEVDWCTRARRAGLRCVVAPTATVVHHRGSASGSTAVVGRLRRNGLLFMRRNGNRRQNAQSFVFFVTVGLTMRVADAYRRRSGVGIELAASAKAAAWNITDAIRRGRWRLPASGPRLNVPGPEEQTRQGRLLA